VRENYKSFWKWFVENKENIKEINSTDYFINELDKRIKEIGNFTWEMGPGINKPLSFTISPGGDPDLLIKTKEIVSLAPNINEWEFYPSIQIKQWNNYFNAFIKGKKIGVEISNWEYVLYQFEDDTYDIVIRPNPYNVELEHDILSLSEMVVDSLIGEEARIEKIVNLDIVEDFDDEVKEKATKIINLRNHLQALNSS
jgi:hypothetical protein